MVGMVLARLLAPLIAVLVLAGCGDYGGGDGDGETTPPATESPTETPTETTEETGQPGAVTITIESFDFGEDVTVKAGQQFTVTNKDGVGHTFTADGDEFDVPVGPGESKTVTIAKAGSYPFHCTPHPRMTGTITVE